MTKRTYSQDPDWESAEEIKRRIEDRDKKFAIGDLSWCADGEID